PVQAGRLSERNLAAFSAALTHSRARRRAFPGSQSRIPRRRGRASSGIAAAHPPASQPRILRHRSRAQVPRFPSLSYCTLYAQSTKLYLWPIKYFASTNQTRGRCQMSTMVNTDSRRYAGCALAAALVAVVSSEACAQNSEASESAEAPKLEEIMVT